MLISVVIPVYRAEAFLEELCRRLAQTLGALGGDYEIILVNDASPDRSWEKIQQLAKADPRIQGLRLSRNFGQHKAITAGLDQTKGDWVVVMDCDLQDQPEEIPKLLAEARKGYDLVLASRADRQDSSMKRASSAAFYGVLSYLTETPQDPSVACFGIYSRQVIQNVSSMRESIRYFPVMVRWVGFRSAVIPVRHQARSEGRSSYNFRKSLHLALDVLLAFSDKPLRLVVKAGLLISLIAAAMTIYLMAGAWSGRFTVLGWPSVMVSLWLLFGITIFVLGFIGLYVGRIFEQVKSRPVYIVQTTTRNPSTP